MKKLLTSIVSAFVLVASAATAEPTNSVRVLDADTFETTDGTRWRLNGVDCPEWNTRDGRRATSYAEKILRAADNLNCRWNGDTTHGRKVGICYVDGVDIGRTLIQAGVCGRCARYDDGRYSGLDNYTGRRARYC